MVTTLEFVVRSSLLAQVCESIPDFIIDGDESYLWGQLGANIQAAYRVYNIDDLAESIVLATDDGLQAVVVDYPLSVTFRNGGMEMYLSAVGEGHLEMLDLVGTRDVSCYVKFTFPAGEEYSAYSVVRVLAHHNPELFVKFNAADIQVGAMAAYDIMRDIGEHETAQIILDRALERGWGPPSKLL